MGQVHVPDKLQGWASPLHFSMLTVAPSATGAGTWTRVVSGSYLYNSYFGNDTTHADGDNISVNIWAPAGIYTLRMNASKNTNRGIVDVDVDVVEVGTADLYAAGVDYLNMVEITGITLSAGFHTLRIRIDGKHASSSNYYLHISSISLLRTV